MSTTNKTNTKSNKAVRPPIVTIMGHVDHGKTSILDYIRKTKIQEREYGGITQHIGAYQISHKSKLITFIDTPGHAAFSQMRSRGGKAADLVVLVVAAEEGVKPQTKEAILHAKAAGVPIIVAINKIDKPGADSQKVKQELAQANIMVEDWGGDIVCVETSAISGKGISELLDAILAVAEMENLVADSNAELEAIIIESKLDPKRGVVVSCIVKSGSLKVGSEVTGSGIEAKVKSMVNPYGISIDIAGPSTPVEILGFKTTPHIGDLIVEKGSELAELSIVDDHNEVIGANTKRTVGIIIRADTQGTLEAVKQSLANLITESVGLDFSIKFVHTATGDITDSDVLLASTTDSVIVGFNVKEGKSVTELASELKVTAKTYKTIYDLIDEIKDLLEGTAIKEEQKIKGRAQVIKKFKLPSGDVILGSKILAGKVKENDRVGIFLINPSEATEQDTPLYYSKIKKIKVQKNEVKEIKKGLECGLLLKPQIDEIEPGMYIEVL
ncbi:GTP-binding protein [Candidatus Nomurabacteria bacterium]|uniref:GTP-binding protein n=1 Tax=candidate division WWE3 bacterium TaxID=2053526 RepID=A0A955E0Q1_UNCKA|nr:GTP-binding protein [candidate division WWE3 bacterium]MCB9823821.1 GTP-binding protein [Candidatus Nomurabacteria bacterium]MCB9826773.1 GTP-binding protein [Candidatus Nomurabacteria bacterium]MCB9827616.1 GTP-binding protein [Candidatus Nomurabacteria bacterium]HXK52468.1 GTP-binding protein [bacterium]